MSDEKILGRLMTTYLRRLYCNKGIIKRIFFQDHFDFYRDDVVDMLDIPALRKKPESLAHGYELIHKSLARRSSAAYLKTRVGKNLAVLGESLGLSALEREMVFFAWLLEARPDFDSLVRTTGHGSMHEMVAMMSRLFACVSLDITQALSAHGILQQSGILRVDIERNDLPSRLKFMPGLPTQLESPLVDAKAFFRERMLEAPRSTMCLDDFQHCRETVDTLLEYLAPMIQQHKPGVNVLIHGVPGTGKTELSRLLAKQLGCALWEVSSMREEHVPMKPAERLESYVLAQRLLGHSPNTMMLFDEADDVLPRHSYAFLRLSNEAIQSKAWFNRQLESNLVPTVWITNDVYWIDPAYLRRFDLIFEIAPPTPESREQILVKATADMGIDASWVRTVAKAEAVTPAHIGRAASVARACGLSGKKAQQLMQKQISETFLAVGDTAVARVLSPARDDIAYDINCCNPSEDIEALANALSMAREGRLLFYGAPGTGKSAFAKQLAATIGVPLRIRKASDLISPYVGETEKNIARAFYGASRAGAALLIDEADTFLTDRRFHASRHETSMVNEMLTQLESFNGLFMASTNMLEKLDSAALRRFDFKVEFGFLKPDQAWRLFCQVLGEEPNGSEALHQALARLAYLTPGNFAVAARQKRLRNKTVDAEWLLEILATEMQHNEAFMPSRPVGFVH